MCSSTLCATTIIQGQDSSYIGKKLSLYTWNDGWEYTKTILDTCTVAPNGQFTFEFTINETRKAQLTLGKYEGCIFVEPNKRYSVNLPVYETPTPADQLNPFYKPQELLLSLNQLPQDDINHQIAPQFLHRYRHLLVTQHR